MRFLSVRRAALAAAVVVGAVAPSTADATHWLKPATTPSHLNPGGTLYWGLPAPEALRSDPFSACTTGNRPGLLDFSNYVNYWWGTRRTDKYNCRGSSLHGEGRAIDYFVNKNNASEKAIGDAIFNFWRKSDTAGSTYMPMKRFGVQTVIWNCQIYSSSNMTIRTYYKCVVGNKDYTTDPTARHEDHVHIDINKAAAERNRTAWSGWQPCYNGHGSCPQ